MAHASRHINVARMAGPGDVWCPPESVYDTLTECPVCDGDGSRDVLDDGHKVREVCPACEGYRYLDSEGYPYKGDDE